ncbi:hypothetical protein V6255_11015 [Psychromonas arctica]|uniref:Uncharacterized protein n=1 Tax=Psychromonas arctica TaxID=168275 RepID=A0ABU9HCP8_9GAMM
MVSKFQKWILLKACSKIAPTTIYRSSPESDHNDFYSIKISTKDNRKLLIRKIDGLKIFALIYDENRSKYCIEETFYIDQLDINRIEIKHYLYNFYTTYKSINEFALHYLLKKDVFKIKFLRLKDRVAQTIFNQRILQIKPRLELLEYIIENYGITNKEFGLISLMSDIYSLRCFRHPDKEKCLNKLRMYLKSFIESGEIIKNSQGNDSVTGKAIVTLEQYQNDERRHNNSVRVQYSMVLLTLLLAFLASIQAGLIKLKPIFDLT